LEGFLEKASFEFTVEKRGENMYKDDVRRIEVKVLKCGE